MSLCTCDLCSLPVFAFVFCITYSWWWHYEWVTRTHCQVWNIAPSISGTSTLEVLTFSFFLIDTCYMCLWLPLIDAILMANH